MYFKEILRVRNALLWYTAILLGIAAFVMIVAVSTPPDKVTYDSHGNKIVTDSEGNKVVTDQSGGTRVISDRSGKKVMTITTKPENVDNVPWVGVLGGAGLIAAILATVLGSTLATENDHLEVAWTRPRSRTRYATALMAVDAVGIVIAQLITFAVAITAFMLFVKVSRLINGSDDALNVLRFLLFPLAWYGLIVAFSAGMRGKAGLVQGLIWPIALTLAILTAVPLPEIWHRIFATVNLLNPMGYIAFREHNMQLVAGQGYSNVALAVTALAIMVLASWFAATYQWRRLQA
jgi:hypothetical protein